MPLGIHGGHGAPENSLRRVLTSTKTSCRRAAPPDQSHRGDWAHALPHNVIARCLSHLAATCSPQRPASVSRRPVCSLPGTHRCKTPERGARHGSSRKEEILQLPATQGEARRCTVIQSDAPCLQIRRVPEPCCPPTVARIELVSSACGGRAPPGHHVGRRDQQAASIATCKKESHADRARADRQPAGSRKGAPRA